MKRIADVAEKARALSVLMKMFETVYLPLLENPDDSDSPERRASKEMACVAYYHMSDLADSLAQDADKITA